MSSPLTNPLSDEVSKLSKVDNIFGSKSDNLSSLVRGKFVIHGGEKLEGEIEVKGAKNACLPIMCATILAEGEFILKNVPSLSDVVTMSKLLTRLGLTVEKLENDSYRIINNGLTSVEAPYDLVSEMRASFTVMGPLLASQGNAKIALPGGCALGARAVDQHLNGFEKMGAEVNTEHGFVHAKSEKLVGSNIVFDFVSVGATENIMMAAVLANGETVMENSAKEPEVVDLGNFLIAMGADIEGLGTDKITIQGVDKLKACEYSVMPDRIETGTYIIMSLITGGGIRIKNSNLDDLPGFVSELEKMGVSFVHDGEFLTVSGDLDKLKNTKISTMPHPGFPTDLQPQTMVLLSLIGGTSEFEETIFSNRFMLVPELNRMGSNISVEDRKATIEGNIKFEGTEVTAPDLRAGASLVLAGLVADNTTVVNDIYHIERGYDDLAGRLGAIGAKIEKVD